MRGCGATQMQQLLNIDSFAGEFIVVCCSRSRLFIYHAGWFRTWQASAWQKITGQSHLPNMDRKPSQKVYSNFCEVPVVFPIVIVGGFHPTKQWC